jgi:hypothetical protein
MAHVNINARVIRNGPMQRLGRFSIYLIRGDQNRVYAVLTDRWFGPSPDRPTAAGSP